MDHEIPRIFLFERIKNLNEFIENPDRQKTFCINEFKLDW